MQNTVIMEKNKIKSGFIAEDLKIIAENMKFRRKELQMTHENVGNIAGMSAVNYGEVERGERNITIKTLANIAFALECNAEILLQGTTLLEKSKNDASYSLNQENQHKCRKILDRYGYRPQMLMVIEECSELQKAVCKMLRNGTSATAPSDNFKEEIVDVVVMVTQACMMAGLSVAEINTMAEKKLDRVLSRQ